MKTNKNTKGYLRICDCLFRKTFSGQKCTRFLVYLGPKYVREPKKKCALRGTPFQKGVLTKCMQKWWSRISEVILKRTKNEWKISWWQLKREEENILGFEIVETFLFAIIDIILKKWQKQQCQKWNGLKPLVLFFWSQYGYSWLFFAITRWLSLITLL